MGHSQTAPRGRRGAARHAMPRHARPGSPVHRELRVGRRHSAGPRPSAGWCIRCADAPLPGPPGSPDCRTRASEARNDRRGGARRTSRRTRRPTRNSGAQRSADRPSRRSRADPVWFGGSRLNGRVADTANGEDPPAWYAAEGGLDTWQQSHAICKVPGHSACQTRSSRPPRGSPVSEDAHRRAPKGATTERRTPAGGSTARPPGRPASRT